MTQNHTITAPIDTRFAMVPIEFMRSSVSDTAKNVWTVFAGHCCPEDPIAWPSLPTVAKILGKAEETVRRAKNELIKAGWLQVWERIPGKQTFYRIIFSQLPVKEAPKPTQKQLFEPKEPRQLALEHTPLKNEGGAESTPLENEDIPPSKTRSTLLIEHTKEHTPSESAKGGGISVLKRGGQKQTVSLAHVHEHLKATVPVEYRYFDGSPGLPNIDEVIATAADFTKLQKIHGWWWTVTDTVRKEWGRFTQKRGDRPSTVTVAPKQTLEEAIAEERKATEEISALRPDASKHFAAAFQAIGA